MSSHDKPESRLAVIQKIQDMQKSIKKPKKKDMAALVKCIDWIGDFSQWPRHLVCPFFMEDVSLRTKEASQVWMEVDSPEFRQAMKDLSKHTSENIEQKDFSIQVCASGLLLAVREYRKEIKLFEDDGFDRMKEWTYSRLGYSEFALEDPPPSATSDACKFISPPLLFWFKKTKNKKKTKMKKFAATDSTYFTHISRPKMTLVICV